MKIKQFKGKDWNYIETPHFIRYIRPLDRKIDEKDLEKQEEHFKKFCKLFKILVNRKIKIFTVSDRSEMKEFVGRETNGFAQLEKWTVWSINIYHPHEVVHVLAENLLGATNNLLGEGLAVLFGWDTGWHMKSFDFWMKQFVRERTYIKLTDLWNSRRFRDFDADITYPESAAVVKFIIDNWGIKKFMKLYSAGQKNPDEAAISFENILGIGFEEFEKKFLAEFS